MMRQFFPIVFAFLFIAPCSVDAKVADDYARDVKGKKNIQELEGKINYLVDRLLQNVRASLNKPDCNVPIIYPGDRDWVTGCGGVPLKSGSQTKAVGQTVLFSSKREVNKKATENVGWHTHYVRWTKSIAARVPHIGRKDFPGYYLPITFRNDLNVMDLRRSRQRGMELLLPDARTLLVFTFTDYLDHREEQWSSLIRLALIDVRALPPEYWATTYREAEINDYSSDEYKVVGRTGNSEEWLELRSWSKDMKMTRALSGDVLLPNYPPPSDDTIQFGIALAELRWQRLADHVDDVRTIKTRAQTEQRKIRQQQAREFRAAIAKQNASHGNSSENTPAFTQAANAIFEMARRENELASIRNNVMRQRIAYDANLRRATNSSSTSTQTGAVLARTETNQSSTAESSCRTRKYPSNSPANNQDCYQRNRNFVPNQGHYCEGGYARHYSDDQCDFEVIKAELIRAAQQKHSGTTRGASDTSLSFNASGTKDKFCAAGYQENRKFDVTTQFQSATCEEAQVLIGQRTWPGVNCIVEVSYTCSKSDAAQSGDSAHR